MLGTLDRTLSLGRGVLLGNVSSLYRMFLFKLYLREMMSCHASYINAVGNLMLVTTCTLY
jgi:hypothetical protein